MTKTKSKNILLGVSGGIAAYKACDIISKLKYLGYSVRVVATANALKFVGSITYASLTQHPVLSDMWLEAQSGEIDHIKVTQEWADLLVVAPATANIIGKFAHGISDDYLSTVYLAAYCKKIIAPAMNTTMWESPAVKRNIQTLKKDGCLIVNPATGLLACGTTGEGKLNSVDHIIEAIQKEFK
jgi:phosphopantothenoylcysteine decarboxylase/phosphopantothenate--cysteine ligase